MNALTKQDAEDAAREADALLATYEEEKKKLEENPELKKQPRWYRNVTRAFRRAAWYGGVVARFENQSSAPTREIEWHVLRLGDAVFATNPFEYYLDYGTCIKARSPAAQTFLVQLAGGGTYVPSARSVAGGGYGSVPASNPVGPVGGRQLAEETVAEILRIFPTPED